MSTFGSCAWLVSLGLGLALVGCSSSSSDETMEDAGKADTMAPASTFSDVWAIISDPKQGDCGDCHKAKDPSANLDLSSKATAYESLVNQPVETTGDNDCQSVDEKMLLNLEIVTPGDPEHSLLWLKISESPPPCGIQMPKNRKVLSAEAQATFKSWITGGAKND